MPAIARNTDPISCGDLCANGGPTVLAGSQDLPVVIKSNPSAGADGNPPTAALIASTNVFKLDTGGSGSPNFGVVRVGDAYLPHPGSPPHTGRVVTMGASNVFANSGGGAGAIVDNNVAFVNGAEINPFPPPVPLNMRAPNTMGATFIAANPHISQAEIQFYETDDEETAQPSPPAGTTLRSDRNVTEEDNTQAPINAPPVFTCSNVVALPAMFTWTDVSMSFDTWAQGFQLSSNFTVFDLTVAPAVSTYRFDASPIQPVGLTQKQILTNMCFLANTLLEPLRTQFGSFTITSAWRNAINNSQHNKGQAADIQFLSLHGQSDTAQQYFQRAKDIRDQFNFDQMILEWFGKNPWIHISVNPASHRNQVLTQVASNSYQPGLKLIA